MRYINYYGKKFIKYLFGIAVILLLIAVPTFTLIKNSDDDSKLDVIEQISLVPEIKPSLTKGTEVFDETMGNGIEYYIDFDEESYNGYQVVDYLFVLNTNSSTPSGYLVDQYNPMYWAPSFADETQVRDSIAFNLLLKSNIDSTSIEDKEQKVVNHLLSNENHYVKDQVLTVIYESYFISTLEVVAVFEKEVNGQIVSQTVEMNPIQMTYSASEKSNRDQVVVNTPDVTFGTTQQAITQEGPVGNKHSVINKFIYDGDPTGNLSGPGSTGHSAFSIMENRLTPRFEISSPNLLYIDEIFAKSPELSLTMYLSDDSENTLSTGDILIYDDVTSVLDLEQLSEGTMITPSLYKLSSIEGVYDETNTLTKNNIKFQASISYQYKTEEEIKEAFPGKDVVINDYSLHGDELITNNIQTGDEWMLVAEDDLKIFQDMAKFDRTDFPEMVIYPNFDDTGRYNVIFATKDQYIFNSPEYFQSDMYMLWEQVLVNERTGQAYSSKYNVSGFEKYEYEGTTWFGTRQYAMNSMFESETYYLSNSSHMWEKFTYTANDEMSAVSYKPDSLTSYYTNERRYVRYGDLKFTTLDSFNYNENVDGLTFVTSDNFKMISSHTPPDYKEIMKYLILIILILVIIPLIVLIVMVVKRKISENT